jgi:light-regulated signal transduction histidine kinase (bacteriophytochrome)
MSTSPVTAADWHLVLGRDGTVLGATDGAPAAWVGAHLDERADVPEDLKEAGRTAVVRAHESASPGGTAILLPSTGHRVHLTVVDAVPIRRVSTDLRALLRTALEVMRQQARSFDVALNVVFDDRVPALVSIDAGKVAWATTLLVGNALRYVRHGSQVMPGGSITVRVTHDAAAAELTIEVQDDGAGIPAERLALLFTVGHNQPPAGLGLSMVREVVTAHGGRLDVHSETRSFRRGTSIRFTLPVSRPA